MFDAGCDGRGEHNNYDRHEYIRQIGDDSSQNLADWIGPKHAEGELEDQQDQCVEDDFADNIAGIEAGSVQGAPDSAALDELIEAEAFQNGVDASGYEVR